MGKIKALAWTHIAINGLLLLMGLWLCVTVALTADKYSRAPEMILPMVATLSLFVLIPGLVGGIGLLYLQSWARVLIILLSLMELLLIPVGTVLGAFGLWVLLGHDAQRAFGDKIIADMMERAAASPGEAAAVPNLGVIAIAAGVGSGFIVFLGAGFMISGDIAPPELMSVFYPGVGVFVLSVGYGIYQLIRNPPSFNGPDLSFSFNWRRRDFAAENRARLAMLRADPARAKYAALIEAGDDWSDEQIAYDLDPAATITCAHLQPIERGMRAAHVVVKPWTVLMAHANCRVNEAAMKARFAPAASVYYTEPHIPDRSLEDPPSALVACEACSSRIFVVHASQANASTPVFPS